MPEILEFNFYFIKTIPACHPLFSHSQRALWNPALLTERVNEFMYFAEMSEKMEKLFQQKKSVHYRPLLIPTAFFSTHFSSPFSPLHFPPQKKRPQQIGTICRFASSSGSLQMEEATEAERCLKIKVDKLQECLEELIDEMETASPRRTSSLGLDSPSRQSSLMQDSKGNPLPAAAQLQIASLNTQLYQKDLQIQALQGRLASYEAGSLLSPTQTLSLPNSSFSAVGSKKKATDLAGTTLSRSSSMFSVFCWRFGHKVGDFLA